MRIDLICGDALKEIKKIKDKSIDLIVIDPPYDISATNGGGTINNIKKLNKSLNNLVQSNINKGYDIEAYGNEFIRIMKTINIYIWCNKKQIPRYFDFYVTTHKCKFDIIAWHKTNALPTYSNKYLSDTEYCLYFRNGDGKCFPHSYEDAKTYYISPINQKDRNVYNHPTIKPLPIIERFVKNSSQPGDLILDCFMGSGTTGVACVNTERDFIGVEIKKEYFEIAQQRIEKAKVEHSIKQTSLFDE